MGRLQPPHCPEAGTPEQWTAAPAVTAAVSAKVDATMPRRGRGRDLEKDRLAGLTGRSSSGSPSRTSASVISGKSLTCSGLSFFSFVKREVQTLQLEIFVILMSV